MAVCTFGVSLGSSADANTYTTAAYTPAANDLLIALADSLQSVDPGAYTSSDAGKTFSEFTSALFNTSIDTAFAFVADQLADADSQTGTLDVTGDMAIGSNSGIIRVSGMTLTGPGAIRQFKIVENQAAGGTPEVIFDSACLTGNPTFMAVYKRAVTTVTTPAGWANTGGAISHGTPNARLNIFTRDSGFTGTTITAGGTSDGDYAVIGIELDASAPGGVDATADITEADDTLASDGTVSLTGIDGEAAITEQNDTVAAEAAVPITAALAVTEQNDTLAATAQMGGVGPGVSIVANWSRGRMGAYPMWRRQS